MTTRGNETFEHHQVKEAIVKILRDKGRKVKPECTVPSLTTPGREWVIDVADVTDPGHPVYYEIQKGSNKSFRTKMRMFAKHTGKDLVPVYINDITPEVRRNMVRLRTYLEDVVH